MWISSDIYVHTCVCARVSTGVQYREANRGDDDDDDSFLACLGDPPRRKFYRTRATFNDTRVYVACNETRRATKAGPREPPVLVSDDQCVRSSSLNVRDTLVAITKKKKIGRYTRDRLRMSRFNPLRRSRRRYAWINGSVCELIVDRCIINRKNNIASILIFDSSVWEEGSNSQKVTVFSQLINNQNGNCDY